MKCPNCGCEDFYAVSFATGPGCVEGGAWEQIEANRIPVEAYLCKKCGRIELYGTKTLKAIKAGEEEKAKQEAEELAKAKRKEALLKEKEKLEAIVRDENQTVKTVREAEERLKEISKELPSLEPCGNH